ncbi:hypothetical protein CCYA_CCYA01G0148 [Cyanidiococcus yangmingshanensis]|nr:hypothetical protein CCYA_CCYA01G0148 [Cyanidiococcus yangmingshanensis]
MSWVALQRSRRSAARLIMTSGSRWRLALTVFFVVWCLAVVATALNAATRSVLWAQFRNQATDLGHVKSTEHVQPSGHASTSLQDLPLLRKHNLSIQLKPEWRVEQKLSYVGVIVFPKEKRLLCSIPKAACTNLRAFALRKQLNVRLDPSDAQNFTYIHPVSKRFLLQLGSLSDEQVQYALTHPDWRYAAVVRHPLSRLLSAYLDKVVGQRELWRRPLQRQPVQSFEHFVRILEDVARRYRKNWDWVDEHWRPQSGFCLFRFLPRELYDYVVKVENRSALRQLFFDMFDDDGRVWIQDQDAKAAATHQNAAHARSANAKLRAFVDESLAKRIQRLYAEDYARFGYGLWPDEDDEIEGHAPETQT